MLDFCVQIEQYVQPESFRLSCKDDLSTCLLLDQLVQTFMLLMGALFVFAALYVVTRWRVEAFQRDNCAVIAVDKKQFKYGTFYRVQFWLLASTCLVYVLITGIIKVTISCC